MSNNPDSARDMLFMSDNERSAAIVMPPDTATLPGPVRGMEMNRERSIRRRLPVEDDLVNHARPRPLRDLEMSTPAHEILEHLRTSTDPTVIAQASRWLRANFEPWMTSSFAHRLYDPRDRALFGEIARFLATQTSIDMEVRISAALLCEELGGVGPPVAANTPSTPEHPWWFMSLRGPQRADARAAIVRAGPEATRHLLAHWSTLSESDRRWATGRLPALSPDPLRVDLLTRALRDTSEAVVVAALQQIIQDHRPEDVHALRTAIRPLRDHASALVRTIARRLSM